MSKATSGAASMTAIQRSSAASSTTHSYSTGWAVAAAAATPGSAVAPSGTPGSAPPPSPAAGPAPPAPETLAKSEPVDGTAARSRASSIIERISQRSNIVRSAGVSSGCSTRLDSIDSKWSVRSQSVLIVTSARAVGSQPRAARRFSPTTPPIFGAAAITPSSVSCSASHLQAVLGPTFETPGTLSTVSPTSDR